MAIFRGTTSVEQAAKIDPKRGAAGSLAESYRSHISKAPSKFRSSMFDPDTASLEALKGRSGEISAAMTPAPRELEFSDTGNVRDVWSQSLPLDIGFGGSDMMPEGEMSFMPNAEALWSSGKDVTTGRILREHPDKFKSEGDPLETGGRFFERAPAISRRIDPTTARPIGATGEDYGKPGGYKFIGESSSKPSFSPFMGSGFGSPPSFGSPPAGAMAPDPFAKPPEIAAMEKREEARREAARLAATTPGGGAGVSTGGLMGAPGRFSGSYTGGYSMAPVGMSPPAPTGPGLGTSVYKPASGEILYTSSGEPYIMYGGKKAFAASTSSTGPFRGLSKEEMLKRGLTTLGRTK
jgi:hypothetical protein